MSESTIDRRALLKTAGAALSLSTLSYAAAPRRKFANVGVGSRSRMYLTAITKTFAANNELVGVCDVNQGRLDTAERFVKPNGGKPKKYLAADFDKMIKETKPDCLIVTCPDGFHHVGEVDRADPLENEIPPGQVDQDEDGGQRDDPARVPLDVGGRRGRGLARDQCA